MIFFATSDGKWIEDLAGDAKLEITSLTSLGDYHYDPTPRYKSSPPMTWDSLFIYLYPR